MDNYTKDTLKSYLGDYLHQAHGINTRKPFRCLNPEHNDKTPSMMLMPDKTNIYCQGCKTTYDLFSLIGIDYNTTDFAEQLKIAAEFFHLLDNTAPTSNQIRPKEQPKNEEVNYSKYIDECAKRFKGSPAETYINNRGISSEVAERFKIGYDPQYKTAILIKEDSSDTAYKIIDGLIIPTGNGKTYNVRNIDTTALKNNRYRNCKGGSKALFNGSILNICNDNIVICEGELDALSIIESGYNAIGLGSSNNVGKFIELIATHRPKKTLILALDDDEPGYSAEKELAESLHSIGIKFYIAPGKTRFGGYKDANEVLQEDPQGLKSLLKQYVKLANEIDTQTDGLSEIETTEEFSTEPKSDIDKFIEQATQEGYRPISSGIKFIDDLLGGGFISDTMTFVYAAPGTGKTTLCQFIVESLADKGLNVLYYNFESSRNMMLAKAISSRLARKNIFMNTSEVLQGFKWTDTQKSHIEQVAKEYNDTTGKHIRYNYHDINPDIDELREALISIGEKCQTKGKPSPVVVIDYIHLLRKKGISDPKEVIKEACNIIGEYVHKYHTIAIVISAVGRTSNGGRITLSSARDTSNIEYNADYTISMEYFDIDNKTVSIDDNEKMEALKNEPLRRIILRTLKNRWGIDGASARIYFDSAHNMFYGENDKTPDGIPKKTYDDKKPIITKKNPTTELAALIKSTLENAKSKGISDKNYIVSLSELVRYLEKYSPKKIRDLAVNGKYGFELIENPTAWEDNKREVVRIIGFNDDLKNSENIPFEEE